MLEKIINIILGLVIVFVICVRSPASETMDSQLQLQKSKFRFVIYTNDFMRDSYFSVGSDKVKILDQSGNNIGEQFSFSNVEYKCKSTGQQNIAKIIFNPLGGLIWWGKMGTSIYSISIPTNKGTNFNLIKNSEPGKIAGVGFRYSIFPDTIVSPALGIGCEFSSSKYIFDILFADDQKIYSINNSFEHKETQIDFGLSKKMRKFEPYGGIKIRKTNFSISENNGINFEQVSGSKDEVSIYLGSKIKITDNEYMVLEGNSIAETTWSMGIGAEF